MTFRHGAELTLGAETGHREEGALERARKQATSQTSSGDGDLGDGAAEVSDRGSWATEASARLAKESDSSCMISLHLAPGSRRKENLTLLPLKKQTCRAPIILMTKGLEKLSSSSGTQVSSGQLAKGRRGTHRWREDAWSPRCPGDEIRGTHGSAPVCWGRGAEAVRMPSRFRARAKRGMSECRREQKLLKV